jgi:hypothetical protein
VRCPRSHVLSGVSYSVLFCSTTTSGVAAVGVVCPRPPLTCAHQCALPAYPFRRSCAPSDPPASPTGASCPCSANESLVGQDRHRPRSCGIQWVALPHSPLPGSPAFIQRDRRRIPVAPHSTQYRQDRVMHITGTCTQWHTAHRMASQVQETLGWVADAVRHQQDHGVRSSRVSHTLHRDIIAGG